MKKAMKIMAMVLFVVGMATLPSCTKSNADLILGKWKLDKATASFGGQTFTMSVSDLAAMMGSEIDVDELVVEFKNDGKVYSEGETEPARYTIDGDKLSIITPEETINMIITKLNRTDLVLDMIIEEEEMEGMKGQIFFKRV